jgi:hypothetical protein
MELCSIEDAFPKIAGHEHSERKGLPTAPTGTPESKPSKEERRAAKKKAKRCKGPALDYLEAEEGNVPDPDRPAVKRLGDVPAFVSYADAFPDISGSFEGFSIPKITSGACVTNTEGLPAYFVRGADDEEGFANYSGRQGDNPEYQLVPAAIPSFDSKGVEKAGSGNNDESLPAPNSRIDWKPMTSAKAKTSFVDALPLKIDSTNTTPAKTSGVPPVASTMKREPMKDNDNRDMLLRQIQELTKRLDDLERKQPQKNSQKDILMFVGTGMFLLISFDIALRVAR